MIPIQLVDTVLEIQTVCAYNSHVHGEWHWRSVAANGLRLLRGDNSVSPAVVFAFALMHDSQRWDDDEDPQHGERALAVTQLAKPYLASHEFAKLQYAIKCHTGGDVNAVGLSRTVGVCWDADRLTLGRVGKNPDPKFLFTEEAKRLAPRKGITWTNLTWPELVHAYEQVENERERAEIFA